MCWRAGWLSFTEFPLLLTYPHNHQSFSGCSCMITVPRRDNKRSLHADRFEVRAAGGVYKSRRIPSGWLLMSFVLLLRSSALRFDFVYRETRSLSPYLTNSIGCLQIRMTPLSWLEPGSGLGEKTVSWSLMALKPARMPETLNIPIRSGHLSILRTKFSHSTY